MPMNSVALTVVAKTSADSETSVISAVVTASTFSSNAHYNESPGVM